MASDIIIGGDFNTPLISMDRSSRHNINKKTLTLKGHVRPDGLYSSVENSPFKRNRYAYSTVRKILSRIDLMLGHKTTCYNDQWLNEEIQREIKIPEMNEKGNTT